MPEYAPGAVYSLFALIQKGIPSAGLAGIMGDPATHTYGYHRSRNWNRLHSSQGFSDYSIRLSRDLGGDGDACSALDISLSPDLMKAVTNRLLHAAKAKDPRLSALREFCGTLDGRNTYPWDLPTNSSEGVNTWDSSHLSHVHLSLYRDAATNAAALAPIAAVITTPIETTSGSGTPITPEEDDMTPVQAQMLAYVYNEIRSAVAVGQRDFASTVKASLGTAQSNFNQIKVTQAQIAAVQDAMKAGK